MSRGNTRTFRYIVIVLSIVVVDAVTKSLTNSYIPMISGAYAVYPYGGIGVFSDFFGIQLSINYVANTGALWGLFPDFQIYLVIVRLIVIGSMIIYAFFYNKNHKVYLPLVVIISGAIGNVMDVFLYGHVVDMVNFSFWGYNYPVFNVADSCICVGALWLMAIIAFDNKAGSEGVS